MGSRVSKTVIPTTKTIVPADDNLYVIAIVFNPCGFNTRIRLYNEFVARMKRYSNVKLYTTECVFGEQTFSVTNKSNPQHIQVRTNAQNVWWVKENLINLTVAALPESCRYISWMDADIEFTTHGWVDETINKLSSGYKVLQMFKEVTFLGPKNETLEVNKSFGLHVARDDWKSYAHPGLGWAMRKDEFIKLGGLYDMNPVGSSDLHFAHGLIGNIKNTIKDTMSIGYKRSVCDWADCLTSIVGKDKTDYMKTVGYVDVNIKHHYHGNKQDRQYVSRWDILERFNFDPNTFFVPSTLSSGTLQPNLRIISMMVPPKFREAIVDYFKNRKEDNRTADKNPPNLVTDAKAVYGKSVYSQSVYGQGHPVRTSAQVSKRPISRSVATYGSSSNKYLYQTTLQQPYYMDNTDYPSPRPHHHHHHNGSDHDHHHHHDTTGSSIPYPHSGTGYGYDHSNHSRHHSSSHSNSGSYPDVSDTHYHDFSHNVSHNVSHSMSHNVSHDDGFATSHPYY